MEPSTPMKMMIGMILTGVSFLILYFAANAGGFDKPVFEVVQSSGTEGELMLSPMGLSLVSKVAPIRMRGLMMGGWFAATAIGNKLTGVAGYWDLWSHSFFFVLLAGMALTMAVVLIVLMRPLKRAMPGV